MSQSVLGTTRSLMPFTLMPFTLMPFKRVGKEEGMNGLGK